MRQQKYKNPAESHKRRSESLPYCGRMIRIFSLLFCLTLPVYSVDLCDIPVKDNPLDSDSFVVCENYGVENCGVNNILLPAQLFFSRNVYSQKVKLSDAIEEFYFADYSYYAKPIFTSLVVNRLDGGCLRALAGFNFHIRAINFLSSTTVDWLLSSFHKSQGNENELILGKYLSYYNNTFKDRLTVS